ncbi:MULTISPECIES: metallophosphoesterase [Bradyrhizobium]|jgi:serine/threonine protein phosphatase 1|uniref:Serine/threonine protein phosphatase 1 n=2 Tax=Bradyrhizobium TaxID=374 RepID=A0ABY0P9Y6_9BRAD|nr:MULTISPECIES: metallophosphoesterase [Bradyrhizobium]SDH79779.1 serine/threonine protein phosphatase 1 [Bradyrhizobium ottawaense]SEE05830.1 serine/threonine protein phosphatase 1 [Bradyrhizobium lablabi]SHM01352.1 serine/threonine protein phosphatase 1 [Bradyrhizobium lablabi]
MSFTYVIPDIHGRDDLLVRALADISAHRGGDGGVIVAIGDYVDKGPHSREVVERLRAGIAGWNLVALKGNHDAMMVQGLRDPAKLALWMDKGGAAALASYGGDPSAVPQAHIAWLDQLRLMHVDAHRVYVHAGVDPELPLAQQSEATLLWKRYPTGYGGGFGARHVVHGHDNDPNGPLLFDGRTNLDTLAWRTGRLTVGVFDDDRPGGPVDLIVVRGPPAGL